MKRFKQVVLRTFLVMEVLVFSYMYVFGAQGLQAMRHIKAECELLENSIDSIRTDIDQLEKNIVMWQQDPFYKEKIAREKLGMARSDERVFIVD